MSDDEELRMPFWSHLAELRKRIVWSLVWIVIGFGACFSFSEDILKLLMRPMNTKLITQTSFPYFAMAPAEVLQKLHYTTLIEPFWTHLKIALITGVMAVFPLVMYQIWLFIAPGLLPRERRYAGVFVFFSTLFFGMGVLFCYFILLSFAIPFLLTYKTENLVAIVRIGDYTDFVMKFLLASGLVFELPLVIVLLSRMGIVNPDLLAKYRKYALLAAFILGALLTPTPDVFNQTLISIPIYLLFEVGILLARVFGKKKQSESTDLRET